ncbi:uracil-DNA glycosylase [Limnohabitans sp. Rim8]|jgi:uracil-DNA glycosylase|uniref:uracil-DNA glycosylase n=1 Tax=Limnohabitans sp. Rim8 TaxID=1100718 RepID=UPI003306813F
MQSSFDFAQNDSTALGQRAVSSLNFWPPDAQGLAPSWAGLWSHFVLSQVGHNLTDRIASRLSLGVCIYPPDPLRALSALPLDAVRVVILGQDPYHGPGQAEGLAFSVPKGVKLPPSLRNIFKEVQQETQKPMPSDGQLDRWVQQGVLLLNTTLTVEQGLPASHANWGWETFTDSLIQALAQREIPLVFMLWGAHAQTKNKLIAMADPMAHHLVLQCNHPSPLSALRPPLPFMGCGHFSAANAFLLKNAQTNIIW